MYVKNDVLCVLQNQVNDDYDNNGKDNCDYNFVTFDDFGVKNDQKVSNNMILMSKYKGKHGGKKKTFFYRRASLINATKTPNIFNRHEM